jgi:hypothetical protein
MIELNKEKVLCMLVLNDDLGAALSDRASDAFWRGFITQNRATGEINGKMRFKYIDPPETSWMACDLSAENQRKSVAERVACLQEGIECIILGSIQERHAENLAPPKGAFTTHWPPDDGGDLMATVRWLEEMDLINVRVPTPEEAENLKHEEHL